MALTCAFNRWGTLLAVGCNDGRVVIIDFITRGTVKVLSAHVQPVCSVSWSHNGRKLLTASTDNSVVYWDVLTAECEHRYNFPSPVLTVQFHPRNMTRFIVCPLKHATLLVGTDGSSVEIPTHDDLGTDLYVTSAFGRKGRTIVTGNGKGLISVYDTESLKLLKSFRLPSNHAIKSIVFSGKRDSFLTNSADRIIRVYNYSAVVNSAASDPDPVQRLQDLVNRTPWKACFFSGDCEYVCAGSAKQHALYIWEKNSGSLVKILHGTKGETLLDAVWHPARPVICSISTGVVSVWAQAHVENWSAFAPDFKELDENVEYDERESEFDLEDEDRSVELNADKMDEDVEVDVTSVEPPSVFYSSDSDIEDDCMWYLPVTVEIEDPDESFISSVGSAAANQQTGAGGGKTKGATKAHDIPMMPTDEVHPLLATGRKKAPGGGGGRSQKLKR